MNPLRCPACSLASDLQGSGSGIRSTAQSGPSRPRWYQHLQDVGGAVADPPATMNREGGRRAAGPSRPDLRILRLGALACAAGGGPVHAADELGVTVTYLSRDEPPLEPLSLVEPILTDEGLMGARQALDDNQTTGRFLGHSYELVERIVPEDGDLGRGVRGGAGCRRASVRRRSARRSELLRWHRWRTRPGALLFNARAPRTQLRTETCHASVLHTAPVARDAGRCARPVSRSGSSGADGS